LAAAAAKLVNRPVKLVMTREQMYGTIGYRARTIQKLALGAKTDGTLTAIKHDGINETSQLDEFTEYVGVMTRMIYSCPNLSSTHKVVRLDIGSPTFMRAPGESPGSFALECGLDELAYKLKLDPVQLRLKNYAEMDEESGLPWSSKALRECYAAASEKFGWSKRPAEPRSLTRGNKLVGWGMATATYPVMGQTAKAKARLKADGSLIVQSGSQDIGTGTYTIMTQIAGDKLSLPIEKIKFELGDTDLPATPVSGGSMTAASVGSAVELASLALLSKVKDLCVADKSSPLSGMTADQIEPNNGRLVSMGDRSLSDSYVDILKRNGLKNLEADATANFERHSKQYGMHSFGAQFAEVEIDKDLGTIHVSRFVGAFGAGKILNAKTARSQFIGGITYGIGMALTEEALWDDKFGRVMNADLAEYHVPVNADIHDIEVIMIDEVDPHINPIGVKGIGEIGIVGVAAAIGNAVYHATGVRVRELPITLDKVLV
jgi:xanthine dehydrogenase YagR molybdenum-binding subunit